MDHSWITSEVFWPSALGVIPVALAAAAICRWTWSGPTTRHAVWVAVLASFLVPMALLPLGLPGLLQSLRTDADSAAASVNERTLVAIESELAKASTESLPLTASPVNETAETQPTPSPAERESASVPPSRETAVKHPQSVVRESPALRPLEPTTTRATTEPRRERTSRTASERTLRAADTASARAMDQPSESSLTETPVESTSPPRIMARESPTVQEAVPSSAQPIPATSRLTAEASSSSVEGEAASSPATATTEDDATATVVASGTWSSRLASLRPRVNAWLDGVQNVRRAITSLPPMPTTIWLGGALVIALVTVARFAWIHRVLRDSLPGSARVRDLVAEEGSRLGLARLPVVRMVSARVSPMVWCGRTCVLLLPECLWAELDEAGRRAVVVHELAHLKRRDHWVRWVELVVSVLYWWHPVVWWVRRRVREESDLCCDAWVTTLMPTGRRSYAQALLCTKAFLVMPGQGRPALGHGALTSAGRRFARRVTMVMKGRPSPRTSIWGTALSLGLLLAAAAATPILACPPDEKTKAEQAVKVELERQKALEKAEQARAKALAQAEKERQRALERADTERRAALERGQVDREAALAKAQVERARALEHAEAMRRAELATAATERLKSDQVKIEEEAATTFERFMRDRGEGSDDSTELLRRLLERIERLEKRLDSFENRGARSAMPGSDGLAAAQNFMSAPSARGSTVTAVTPPSAATPQPTPRSASTSVGSGGGGGFFTATSPTAAPTTERSSRQYTLPKGKLELLNQLMIREDVPVLVSPSSNSITVHGTAEQHAIFKAFIDMIHPTSGSAPAPTAQPGAAGSRSGRVSTTNVYAADLQSTVASLQHRAEQLQSHSTAIQSVMDRLKYRAAKADEAEKQQIHKEMERLVAEMAQVQVRAAELRAHADKHAEHNDVKAAEAR